MRDANLAPFYACMYHGLCDTARKHGYALAIHGSVITDMDLVAVPWTEEAVDAVTLMEAIKKHVEAVDYHTRLEKDLPSFTKEEIDQLVRESKERSPENKPHGRLAWNLYLEHGAKIDLSIMPRLPKI